MVKKEGQNLPARFVCFIDRGDGSGKYDAIVQFGYNNDPSTDSVLTKEYDFPMPNEDHKDEEYHIVMEEDYVEACYVIKLLLDEDLPKDVFEDILVIKDTRKWPSLF